MENKENIETPVETKETKTPTEEIKEQPKKESHFKKHNKNDEEIIKLQEELAKEKERAMRIQAEMVNFRKRKEDEVANMYKYANEDILKELLAIVDNFERALSMENKENKEFLKGFEMIYTGIKNILNKNEVSEIDALNNPFDPNLHQAVLTEKVEGVDAGVVIQVLQKGYKYKERILRPSMVKVSE